ncbi:hypothetical protein FLGE108171_13225 [Flavobacterium gelidilacus]|uniref:hypothetical protein n=1 Tax=Flavobacterium gelidilacus TaxID=206041 RepID=UPI0004258DEA|nr:hypothetical protein [Flavobacterium gelidilacus]
MKKLLIILFASFVSCFSTKKQTIQYEIRGTVLNLENKPIDEVEILFYNDGETKLRYPNSSSIFFFVKVH